eukprot:gene26414-61905_t
MLFGGLLRLLDEDFDRRGRFLESFLLFILPPIIFDAGFNLTSRKGVISQNAGAIMTFAIMGRVFPTNKPPMYYLVFGESVLNDAVSIVLYKA